jgi:hypothetical protein
MKNIPVDFKQITAVKFYSFVFTLDKEKRLKLRICKKDTLLPIKCSRVSYMVRKIPAIVSLIQIYLKLNAGVMAATITMGPALVMDYVHD